MRPCGLAGLAALTSLAGCGQAPAPYILQCKGSQVFEWTSSRAAGFTTLYFRIDEARATVAGRNLAGRFGNVCRTSCEIIEFGNDSIRWIDASGDGQGGSTRIVTTLARNSGEMTIRTDSQLETAYGVERTLHGEGHFHCLKVDRIAPV